MSEYPDATILDPGYLKSLGPSQLESILANAQSVLKEKTTKLYDIQCNGQTISSPFPPIDEPSAPPFSKDDIFKNALVPYITGKVGAEDVKINNVHELHQFLTFVYETQRDIGKDLFVLMKRADIDLLGVLKDAKKQCFSLKGFKKNKKKINLALQRVKESPEYVRFTEKLDVLVKAVNRGDIEMVANLGMAGTLLFLKFILFLV
jgi:hypothetical protein